MSATTTQTGNGATRVRRGRKPGATPRHRRTRAEIAAAKAAAAAAAAAAAPIPGRVSGAIHATQPRQPSAAVDPAILFVVTTVSDMICLEPAVRGRAKALLLGMLADL